MYPWIGPVPTYGIFILACCHSRSCSAWPPPMLLLLPSPATCIRPYAAALSRLRAIRRSPLMYVAGLVFWRYDRLWRPREGCLYVVADCVMVTKGRYGGNEAA